MPPAADARRRRTLLIRAALALGVVIAVFVGILPRVADLSSVWTHVNGVGALGFAWLALVAVASLLTYGFVLMSVMPGLTLGQAMVVSQSSTAVANTMPAGGALAIGVSYRFYGSWGFGRPAITRNVLLTGVWNVLCKLAFPVVALALVVAFGQANGGLVAASLVGLVVLTATVAIGVAMLRSERAACAVGQWTGSAFERMRGWLRRSPHANEGGEVAVRFRTDTIGLLRERAGRLTVTMVLFHASVFLVLLVSLRSVGVTAGEVSWIEVLAAFALARLASAVPITPGGIGLVELGLTGALIAAGGPSAEVVAGVLVFRMLSFFLPLPLGVVTYGIWRRNQSWRRPVAVPPALAGI